MKLKFSLLLCLLAALTLSLAGCADRNGKAGTAASSSATTSSISVVSDDNGGYEAGKDGRVTDDIDEAEGTPSDKGIDDDEKRPSDVTDDGMVGSSDNNDGQVISDEAAFAPSYIGRTSGNTKIGWGLGKERDSMNRPVDAVRAQEKYSSLGAEFLAPDGSICLTFDEGYENGYTDDILDTLKAKGVRAVFFVTYDYCRTAPELVRRMIDEGHTVGNHTWSHPSLPDCTQKELWAEITKLNDYVKDEFGYEMKLFRFPKGEFSERTLEDVHRLGMTTLFWSYAYADWDTSIHTDPAEALAKAEDSTHSGIYLFHAVSETNAKILGELLDHWKDKGYTVGAWEEA